MSILLLKACVKRGLKYIALILLGAFFLILLWPESARVPVKGATPADWHKDTFWYEPWGSSGVHKGMDIFAKKGTPLLAATSGWVIFTGNIAKGGNVVAVLGPKWRIHYYAHLDSIAVQTGWVAKGELIGAVGDTGNAKGKPAHLHYSKLSLVPYPWLVTTETQGWKKMFFLDPVGFDI